MVPHRVPSVSIRAIRCHHAAQVRSQRDQSRYVPAAGAGGGRGSRGLAGAADAALSPQFTCAAPAERSEPRPRWPPRSDPWGWYVPGTGGAGIGRPRGAWPGRGAVKLVPGGVGRASCWGGMSKSRGKSSEGGGKRALGSSGAVLLHPGGKVSGSTARGEGAAGSAGALGFNRALCDLHVSSLSPPRRWAMTSPRPRATGRGCGSR